MFVDLSSADIQPHKISFEDIPNVQLTPSLCQKIEEMLKKEKTACAIQAVFSC